MLATVLNTKWEQIPIGNFHRYIDEWFRLYGIATHAHGMYQMEFFEEVGRRCPRGRHLLSGIIGDMWAGHLTVPPVRNSDEVARLGYCHGMSASAAQCRLPQDGTLRERYFNEHAERLQDPRYRIVATVRMKLILLSYLCAVPRSFGFRPWSPFLIPEIALGMLTLPAHRRENRAWQVDLFRKHRVDFESHGLKAEPENTLNLQAIRLQPPPPLDRQLLSEVVDPKYVDWINRYMLSAPRTARWGRGLARRLGLRRVLGGLVSNPNQTPPYCAYLCLKPVEVVLRKRSACDS